MKTPFALAALFTFTAMFAASCGGEGALGEDCAEAGVQDGECESGAICAKHSEAELQLTCLAICTDQSECAVDEACNGVEGTLVKGCRLP